MKRKRVSWLGPLSGVGLDFSLACLDGQQLPHHLDDIIPEGFFLDGESMKDVGVVGLSCPVGEGTVSYSISYSYWHIPETKSC